MKQKQTHRQREQTWDRQREWCGGGMDWEFGISRCKLLYIEWINNKILYIAQGTILSILRQIIREKNMKNIYV